jgi:hypothetical protein
MQAPFEPIKEANLHGYSAQRADGATVELFRCYQNIWAVHLIIGEQRKAIEPGARFLKARAIAITLIQGTRTKPKRKRK